MLEVPVDSLWSTMDNSLDGSVQTVHNWQLVHSHQNRIKIHPHSIHDKPNTLPTPSDLLSTDQNQTLYTLSTQPITITTYK